jgi:tartrate dehydrogenase/decarboxylase / D-malate dehydrogenase
VGIADFHSARLPPVQHPDWFDVVVASNLFGDILSDLGPAIAGLHRHRPRALAKTV